MEMTISIPDDIAATLRQRAAQRGETIPAYTAKLIEQTIKQVSVDDVLAPFRKQVAESGMSDEELDSFFEQIRDQAFQDRHIRP